MGDAPSPPGWVTGVEAYLGFDPGPGATLSWAGNKKKKENDARRSEPSRRRDRSERESRGLLKKHDGSVQVPAPLLAAISFNLCFAVSLPFSKLHELWIAPCPEVDPAVTKPSAGSPDPCASRGERHIRQRAIIIN